MTDDDIQTTGVKHIESSANGEILRVLFTTKEEGEAVFQIPTDAVVVLLPFLAAAAEDARQKSGETDARIVFTVDKGEIGAAPGGQIIFGFGLEEGGQFSFLMGKDEASVFASALSKILEQTDEQTTTPVRH
jgi:hypothetical protein